MTYRKKQKPKLHRRKNQSFKCQRAYAYKLRTRRAVVRAQDNKELIELISMTSERKEDKK